MNHKEIARNHICIALRFCEDGMQTLPIIAQGSLRIVYGMMVMARACGHITNASAGRIERIIEQMEDKAAELSKNIYENL